MGFGNFLILVVVTDSYVSVIGVVKYVVWGEVVGVFVGMVPGKFDMIVGISSDSCFRRDLGNWGGMTVFESVARFYRITGKRSVMGISATE